MKRLATSVFLFLLYATTACPQSFTYYRLSVLNSSAFTCLAELQFFDGGGSQIATTGGTASASSSTFGAAANAFDGNLSTAWCAGGPATPASPVWLQYQFTSGVTAASFKLISTSGSAGSYTETPDSEQMEGSNNGTTWTSLGFYNAPAVWTNFSQTQSITINTSRGTGMLWRISITAGNSGSAVAIADLKFFDSSSTSIDISLATGAGYAKATNVFNGACSPGDCGPSQAIDGTTSYYYASNTAPTSGSPINLDYQFTSSSPPNVCTFEIWAGGTGGSAAWYPTAFTIAYSTNGGSSFNTVGTYAPSASSWGTTNPQTFATTLCGASQIGAFIVGP